MAKKNFKINFYLKYRRTKNYYCILLCSLQSPRNLNIINKAKVAESSLAQKPSTKKKAAANSANSNPVVQEEVDSQIEKIAVNKSEALKSVLDDINLKLLSSCQQP